MKKQDLEAFEKLPKDLQEFLTEAFKQADTVKEFIRITMVGECPLCGSENTMDCDDTPLGDICVGICLDCFSLWCLECGEVFEEGQRHCSHWEICDSCDFGKHEENCGFSPSECPIIQDRRNEKG